MSIDTQPLTKENESVINLKHKSIMRKKEKFNFVFEYLEQSIPNPKPALKFNNSFQLLLAVMFSAQTTDISVNKATKKLFAEVFSPEDLLKFGETALHEQIKTVGLAGQKSKNAIKTAQMLIENFKSSVPNNFEDLISLPGVGSKTAKVVLNVGFGQPTVAVDTHIYRVAHRLGLSKGITPDQVSDDLTQNIPKEHLMQAHHRLLLHGRHVCTARNPHCDKCALCEICKSADKKIT